MREKRADLCCIYLGNDSQILYLDPVILKEIAIARREKAYAEKLAKEAEQNPPIEEKELLFDDINIDVIGNVDDLKKLGLDHLKHLLKIRKLKCGGNLDDRAARLFSIKGLAPENYPKKIKQK